MENEIQVVNDKTLLDYISTGGQTITESERLQFFQIAKTFNLNPFKREIYLTAYGEGQYRTLSIVTGYEVYLKRAERTGLLDGWETSIDGKGEDMSCTITIHRKDRKFPFKHTVYFSEVKKTKKGGELNRFWNEQPKFMLKKVAISQGFRLCFPDELGGMPYTNDEIGEKEINNMPEQPQQEHPEIEPPKNRFVKLETLELNLSNYKKSGLDKDTILSRIESGISKGNINPNDKKHLVDHVEGLFKEVNVEAELLS